MTHGPQAASPECRQETPDWEQTTTNTIVSVAALIGIVGSSLLLLYSFCMRRKHHKSILGRMVACLALVDLTLNIWVLLPVWVYQGGIALSAANFVPWCGPWIFVARLLSFWSMLLALSIALSVLMALLKRAIPIQIQKLSPLLCLPLAALLNLGFLIHPATPQGLSDPRTSYCSAPEADMALTIELGVMFTIILFVHVFGVIWTWKHSPNSVVRRLYISARGFLLAFLASNVLGAITFPMDAAGVSCTMQLALVCARDSFLLLNGFFNFLAFRGVAAQHSASGVVTFGEAELLTPQAEQFMLLWTIPEEMYSERSQSSDASPTPSQGPSENFDVEVVESAPRAPSKSGRKLIAVPSGLGGGLSIQHRLG